MIDIRFSSSLPHALVLVALAAQPAFAQDPSQDPSGGGGGAPASSGGGSGGFSQGGASSSSSSSSSSAGGGFSPDQIFGLKPSSTTRVITLEQALERGETMSFDLRIAAEKVKQQEAQVRRAWAALLPQVSVGGNYSYNYPEQTVAFGSVEQNQQQALLYDSIAGVVDQSAAFETDPVKRAEAQERAEQLRGVARALESAKPQDIVVQPAHVVNGNVTASMPIFNGRAVPLLQNAYEAVDLVEHANKQARAGLLHGITRSYYGAATMKRLVEIAMRQVDSAKVHRDAIRDRVELGVATPLSLDRAELEVIRAEQQVLTAQNSYNTMLGGLGQLIGEDEAFDIELPSAMRSVELEGSEEDLVARALSSRPDLMVQKSALLIADRGRTDAWMMFMPTVGLVASGRYTSNTSGFTSQPFTGTVTLNASVPIYDGGSRYAALRESASRVREELLKVRQIEYRIVGQVRGNIADIAVKRLSLQTAQHAVEIARKTHDNARNLYELGVATSLDVIDANFALFVAEMDLARAELELEQSRVGLAYVLGEFPIATGFAPAVLSDDEEQKARERMDALDGPSGTTTTTDAPPASGATSPATPAPSSTVPAETAPSTTTPAETAPLTTEPNATEPTATEPEATGVAPIESTPSTTDLPSIP
jgi:outer membrane protein TolC